MIEFDNLITMCNELQTTNSKNEKKIILAKYPHCKDLILKTMNPYKKYNITSKKIEKLRAKVGSESLIDGDIEGFGELLNSLNNGTLSGHRAVAVVNGFIETIGENYRQLVYNILDKNLKIRIGKKEINKVFGDLIPVFNLCLAKTPTEKQLAKVNGCYFIQRKLDGCRCICRYEDKDIKFISRGGLEFESLGVLKEAIQKKIDDDQIDYDFVLDGEICIIDEKTGAEIFSSIIDEETGEVLIEGIMSYINKSDTIKEPRYKVFDLLTIEEFDNAESDRIYSERYADLKEKFSDTDLTEVIDSIPYTKEAYETMLAKVEAEGWEGLMLRKDVGYEGKKTGNLYKIKGCEDAEYKIESIDTGPFRIINKDTGLEDEIITMTAATILHKGNPVSVGGGWSLDQRIEYFDDPSKIIGKIVTVKYTNESQNKKTGLPSLRHPRLKVVHGEKRNT